MSHTERRVVQYESMHTELVSVRISHISQDISMAVEEVSPLIAATVAVLVAAGRNPAAISAIASLEISNSSAFSAKIGNKCEITNRRLLPLMLLSAASEENAAKYPRRS